MGSALVFLGAVGLTLVAAYQWAGSVGGFGSTTTEFAVLIGKAARGAPQSP